MDRSRAVNAQLRALPAVDKLAEAAGKTGKLARWSCLEAARAELAELRQALREGRCETAPDRDALVARVAARAADLTRPFPVRVINATGIVLHTNLGRAPLAQAAALELASAAAGYSDLELDLASGARGSRLERVCALLRIASGAEAALVVNNTAAALLLTVDTLAAGRDVIVSRGELVEIGGSFRIPDIMASSRARLHEVGTTNRTHLRDYERALGPESGLLLKVHRSNFRVEGFTAEVGLAELAELGRAHGLPVVEDRGSGSFVSLSAAGIPEEPADAGLRAGADLVLFSGDKLLGGPQAGIVLGRAELVAQLRESPLARALRVDKLVLAGLHWTLRALLDGREREIPVLDMLLASPDELRARAARLCTQLADAGVSGVSQQPSTAPVGGGALPDLQLETTLVRIAPRGSASRLAAALRRGEPPVLARVQHDALLLDPRTLRESDIDPLCRALVSQLV